MKFKFIFKFIVILITTIQISFLAHASKGLILNRDGNLNYYENDKFVKQVKHFHDICNEFISLYFTGDYYFIVKKYKNVEKYYIERWNVKSNKSDIINLNSSNSPITGISLVSKGSGYIQSKSGNLDYYLNGTYIKTVKTWPLQFYESWALFFFAGNSLYRTVLIDLDSHNYGTNLFKYSKSADDSKSIDCFDGDVRFMNFNQNGDGIIIEKNIMIDDRIFIHLYKNNVKMRIVERDANEYFNIISVTDDSVYVQLNSDSEGFYINKCDLDLKNCTKLDLLDKDYVYVSFK
jgi:hypothetical protein